ncbi:MAG: copper chaperone [Acidimicrobiales bacterium]|nr:copper chaperone [Acidimicrobiales bacterium]
MSIETFTVETFTVVGLTCGHCVAAVTEELAKLDDVRKVDVDLATGVVTVESSAPIARAVLAAAIDEAGYELQP